MASDPYLAVTLDAKRRIARAADAIEANRAVFTLGYLNLLEHVWERKDARVSALVLSACFGPDPRVPATLVEFGFVVASGGAWDLNQADTDRLLLTYKQRVAAGKARAATAPRAENGRIQRATSGQPAGDQRGTSEPPAASQLLHPAPSTQQNYSSSPSEKNPRAAPADDGGVLQLHSTGTDKHPRKLSEAEEFWSWYQNGRTEKTGLIREGAPDVVALRKWFKAAVSEVTLARLYTAAARYVTQPKDDYWRQRGFPFQGFMSDAVWRKYVPPEERSG